MVALESPNSEARHLPGLFEGCFNFRDAGGYSTRFGAPIRTGMLYRSDAPHALTTADQAALERLEISTVIDLRNDGERHSRFSDHVAGVTTYELPMFGANREHEDFARWADPKIVATRYREILDDAAETISDVLAILTDPAAYPTIVHCTAGKDRTGIVVALLHSIVGVERSMVLADYEQSRHAMPRLLTWMQQRYPQGSQEFEPLGIALRASAPMIMAQFLGDLERDHGSVESYVESLGMGSAIGFLREALLRERIGLAA